MPQMSPFNWTFMFTLFLLSIFAFMSKMFFNKKTLILLNNSKHNIQTSTLYMWSW